jgi:hypothetical protein
MVVVILVSFAPAAAAADGAYITRGETADMLLEAAADYNAGIHARI